MRHWYETSSVLLAPGNDLQLLKDLKQNEQVNPLITTIKKLWDTCGTYRKNWWFGWIEELVVGLTFFDDRISIKI